jgi:hypothetical protein
VAINKQTEPQANSKECCQYSSLGEGESELFKFLKSDLETGLTAGVPEQVILKRHLLLSLVCPEILVSPSYRHVFPTGV